MTSLNMNELYDCVESFLEDILNEHIRPISNPSVLSPFQNYHFHAGSQFDALTNQFYLLPSDSGSKKFADLLRHLVTQPKRPLSNLELQKLAICQMIATSQFQLINQQDKQKIVNT